MMLLIVFAQGASAQTLSKSKVPASGRAEAILTVSRYGRYAIAAESKGGTAIQLISKMQGPGPISGKAGAKNGRLDLILDRGTYKVVTWSASKGKGEATLSAKAFKELNAPEPPKAVEHKALSGTLGDFEQVSYWLPIQSARTVLVEMAARNLSEVRLWKDGEWLLETASEQEVVDPVVGRPLTVVRLSPRLEPGLYLVTAYGGPPLPWSEENGAHPFYARFGVPPLPAAGRFTAEVSPFGVDRYRVAGKADFFRAEVPEARPLTLNVQTVDAPSFGGHGTSASITKTSLPPIAEITTYAAANREHVVTVSGSAGQNYALQFFPRASTYPFVAGHDYSVTTLHAGVPADTIDATAIVECSGVVREASVVAIEAARGYRRRFNLLDDASFFIEVKDAGDYQVDIGGEGVEAQYRIEPFLISRPRGYRTPDAQKSQTTWSLDRGYFVLTLLPSRKGIAEVTIKKASGVRGLLNKISDVPMTPVRASASFPRVSVGYNEACSLRLNDQNVATGALIRDVNDPPPAAPQAAQASEPLPPLPSTEKAAIPKLIELTAGAPKFFDIEAGSEKHFLVRVSQAGLYRLESTGLLAMRGAIRTRTVTSLDTQEQNGTGRNFLVQQYLREGDYQLSVFALGTSAGHFGLQLTPAEVIEGGTLLDGIVARASVPAGSAVLYRFKTPRVGSYRLRSFSIGRTFRSRFEDGEGWPVEPVNIPADLNFRLSAGSYRLLLLPETVESLQLTRIDRARKSSVRKGHGPHELIVGDCGEHTWRESKERTPDAWRFVLPARAETHITLSNGMIGNLYAIAGSNKREVGVLPPQQGFNGSLEAGTYVVETTNVRTDDRVSYKACVRTAQLLEGLTRTLNAPAVVPVSVGRTSLVELSSFAGQDVRATLLDAQGNVIAKSDDRPSDWNFHIATTLAAGQYALRVEPVGVGSARLSVEMRVPKEVLQPELTFPASVEKTSADAVSVFPLPKLPADADLLVIQATANEGVGIAVEQADGNTWTVCGTDVGRRAHLEVPVKTGATLRARLWSIDRRGTPVKLQAAAVATRVRDEGDLSNGVEGTLVDGITPPVSVASFDVKRPGVFAGGAAGVRWTSTVAASAVQAPDAIMALQSARLYLVTDAAARLQAKRIELGQTVTSIEVPQRGVATADVQNGSGALVVLASSRTGQPGLKVQEQDGRSAPPQNGMNAGVRSAVAVSLAPKKPQAVVWPAEALREPMDVKLSAFRFSKVEPNALNIGATASQIAASASRVYTLPKGGKRVHIVADAAVVAVLSQDDEPLAIIGGADARSDETLETTAANRLTLLNIGTKSQQAVIEVLKLDTDPVALKLNAPVALRFAASGVERIVLSAEAGNRSVWTRGASAEPLLLAADGSVRRGTEIAVPSVGGVLLVPHEAGLVVTWLEKDRAYGPGLWGGERALTAKDLFGGERVVLAEAQARFTLRSPAPVVFHLRSEAPALVNVKRGDVQSVTLQAAGVSSDVYVGETPVEVTLRAVSGKALGGALEVTTSNVTALSEGQGPEVLLGSGQSRFFSFKVKTAAAIGVGVRSDADRIDAALLDLTGKTIGRGAAQMPTLQPGTYLVSVKLDPNVAPATLRPAVVGLDPPDTRPPPEIARRYYEAGDGPVEFSASRGNADPDQSALGSEGEETPMDQQMESSESSEGEPVDVETGESDGD